MEKEGDKEIKIPFYCTNSISISSEASAANTRMTQGYGMSTHVPTTNKISITSFLKPVSNTNV